MSVYSGRAAKYAGIKSAERYPQDVFGILKDVKAPSEEGRAELYEYVHEDGTTEVRASTWTAHIEECVFENEQWMKTGRIVSWSWSGYPDDKDNPTQSELGLSIIDGKYELDDLARYVAHYVRGGKGKRSSIKLV